MLTLADAIYLVVRARRNKGTVSDIVRIAVDTYQKLVREYDIKPAVAHKMVDWYLA